MLQLRSNNHFFSQTISHCRFTNVRDASVAPTNHIRFIDVGDASVAPSASTLNYNVCSRNTQGLVKLMPCAAR